MLCVGDAGDKGAERLIACLAEVHARGAVVEEQVGLRSGGGDIEQPALLVDLLAGRAAKEGKRAALDGEDKDDGKLKSVGCKGVRERPTDEPSITHPLAACVVAIVTRALFPSLSSCSMSVDSVLASRKTRRGDLPCV